MNAEVWTTHAICSWRYLQIHADPIVNTSQSCRHVQASCRLHAHQSSENPTIFKVVVVLHPNSLTATKADSPSRPQSLTQLGQRWSFVFGMRKSHFPALVAISRSSSRQRQLPDPLWRGFQERRYTAHSAPESSDRQTKHPSLPFRFETGIGLYAKRPSRPFPPPFTSPPSGSFSDPLSTHHRSRDRRDRPGFVNGELIKGLTNGDDAVYASDFFICANDGVGAWAMRPRGHAGCVAVLINQLNDDNLLLTDDDAVSGHD